MIRVYEDLNLEILGLFWAFFSDFLVFSISDFLTVWEFWAFFRLLFFVLSISYFGNFFGFCNFLGYFGIYSDFWGILGLFLGFS